MCVVAVSKLRYLVIINSPIYLDLGAANDIASFPLGFLPLLVFDEVLGGGAAIVRGA